MGRVVGPSYGFSIRWREELVCSCAEGAFALDMPGHTEVLLPSEAGWAARAPAWAREHRQAFTVQLRAWAKGQGHRVAEWDDAPVYEA